MQEHLRSRYRLSEGYIRELMGSAMHNISKSAVVQLSAGHKLLVYLGHDKFELR